MKPSGTNNWIFEIELFLEGSDKKAATENIKMLDLIQFLQILNSNLMWL